MGKASKIQILKSSKAKVLMQRNYEDLKYFLMLGEINRLKIQGLFKSARGIEKTLGRALDHQLKTIAADQATVLNFIMQLSEFNSQEDIKALFDIVKGHGDESNQFNS